MRRSDTKTRGVRAARVAMATRAASIIASASGPRRRRVSGRRSLKRLDAGRRRSARAVDRGRRCACGAARACVRERPGGRQGASRVGRLRLSKSQSRVSRRQPHPSRRASTMSCSVAEAAAALSRPRIHCRQPIPPSLKASPSAGVASSDSVSSSRSALVERGPGDLRRRAEIAPRASVPWRKPKG